MSLPSPINVSLLQIAEGLVAITGTLPRPGLYYKLYLSDTVGSRGDPIGSFGIPETNGSGSFARFTAKPGTMHYATVNAFDPSSEEESSDFPQILLQS